MFDFISSILSNIFVPLCTFITNLYSFFVSIFNRPNKFWKSFIKDKCISIVLTEYQINTKKGSRIISSILQVLSKDNKIAERVSDGYLVSKGNAKALSNLVRYLSKYVNKEILIEGDKYFGGHKEDLVILGSPVNNKCAERIYSYLEKKYDMPFKINYNAEKEDIEFVNEKNNTRFKPEINPEGTGYDYAIIVNAEYEKDQNVVILAGAYMYGTEAASKFVTNDKILKRITSENKKININNCVFLIRTNVVNHIPQEPTLEKIADTSCIFTLNKKN